MKKIYGLLGRDINYSLSPKMHNAAFEHFRMDNDCKYELFDKKEDELDEFFGELISGEYKGGINVTVPYKVKAKQILENCKKCKVTLHGVVNATGALNTIKIDGKQFYGHNTDVEGFKEALQEDTMIHFFPKIEVFVVGAGGAGRAIALYLAFANIARKVYVYDVDKEKVESLEKDFRNNKYIPSGIFNPVKIGGNIIEKIQTCDLVVNATPQGTKEGDCPPISLDILNSLKKNAVVYDLVYCHETELVKQAREKKLSAANGLGMLINQAALAFNIWTGKPLEETKDVMKGALNDLYRLKI